MIELQHHSKTHFLDVENMIEGTICAPGPTDAPCLWEPAGEVDIGDDSW